MKLLGRPTTDLFAAMVLSSSKVIFKSYLEINPIKSNESRDLYEKSYLKVNQRRPIAPIWPIRRPIPIVIKLWCWFSPGFNFNFDTMIRRIPE